jgi:hypothetical protein
MVTFRRGFEVVEEKGKFLTPHPLKGTYGVRYVIASYFI